MKKNFKMPGSSSETPIRVAIYVRVSTVYQIDKDSLPMMKQDLTSYCKYILNTDDFVIFEDAGYSGKNTDRPAYQKMMSQIRQGLLEDRPNLQEPSGLCEYVCRIEGSWCHVRV